MTADNGNVVRSGSSRPAARAGGGPQPTNLGDILERVLDTGIVIAGDIRVNLLDIELLTIKLRLVIASVDTARQLGIDWWQTDPWLSSKNQDRERSDGQDLAAENRQLRARLAEIEGARPENADGRAAEGAETIRVEPERTDTDG